MIVRYCWIAEVECLHDFNRVVARRVFTGESDTGRTAWSPAFEAATAWANKECLNRKKVDDRKDPESAWVHRYDYRLHHEVAILIQA